MPDSLADAIAAAVARRANEDTTSLDRARRERTANQNHPFRPVPVRAKRRTQRPYRDPTGEDAIGNIKKETKQ